jgi:hypothetical protein
VDLDQIFRQVMKEETEAEARRVSGTSISLLYY